MDTQGKLSNSVWHCYPYGVKIPEALPEWITKKMAELGIVSKLELTKRLGKSGRGTVHNVLAGVHKIPVRDIETWSQALRLSEEEHQEFAVLVNLSHDSPDFQRRYWAQEAELDELRERVGRMRRLVEKVIEEAHRKGLDLGDVAAEAG